MKEPVSQDESVLPVPPTRVDIVTFDDNEPVMALYIDGKLETAGDSYHDSIYAYIEAFVAGMVRAGMIIEKRSYSLTEEAQEKYANVASGEYPKKFPFKKFKYEEN